MIVSNFKIQTRKNIKLGTEHLVLSGEVGINSIIKIKTKIDTIKFDCDKIFFELKNIDSFDLSSVQLLYSLRKSLQDNGKTVSIISDLPGNLMMTLCNAGFDEFTNSLI